jgi:hypothetical protein
VQPYKIKELEKNPCITIEMEHMDQAHNCYVEYCLPDGKEDPESKDVPTVYFIPPAAGVVLPHMAQMGPILAEARVLL